jgi:hypothetical protein
MAFHPTYVPVPVPVPSRQRHRVYSPFLNSHCQPPPPNEQNTRVFGPAVLGGDPTRPVVNRKRSRVRLPTREVKPYSTRIFVAVHLHASGTGIGLGGELLVFSFPWSSFLPAFYPYNYPTREGDGGERETLHQTYYLADRVPYYEWLSSAWRICDTAKRLFLIQIRHNDI